MDSKYVVAIEIGSSLVKGAIGVVDDIGTLKVCAVECRDIVDCVRYGCIQNVEEVRARGAQLYIFVDNKAQLKNDKQTQKIALPSCPEILQPILYTIPLQLLAYYCAVINGTDVDQPRNLAKSVTVE